MSLENLAKNLDAVILNYKESVIKVDDPANKEIQGKIVEETFQLPLVQQLEQATLIADRFLQSKAYTLSTFVLVINRKGARLQRGDLFKFSYTPYNITNMVCRVLEAQEENLESENIKITAIQDINYLSQNVDTTDSGVTGGEGNIEGDTSQFLEALTNVKVIETPYPISGDEVGVLPIASREVGTEVGFKVYFSIDGGISYALLDTVPSFAPSGTLVDVYPITNTNDTKGFSIDSEDTDFDALTSITRTLLFVEDNMSLLGNELISWQTITPDEDVDNRYHFTGIYRNRIDTVQTSHSIGEKFYFLSGTNSKHLTSSKIVPGASLKFKLVPYSELVGDISEATAISLVITGRAKTPYPPINLKINDTLVNPFYSTDCVLTWDPRLRTLGAGIGLAEETTDAIPVWEGLFEVKVYVSSVLVNTFTGIDAITYTYTSAQNIIDNGSLATSIEFRVSNYLIENNFKYQSNELIKTVTKS